MPANPFKDEQLCRAEIDHLLTKLSKGKIPEMDYKFLVKTCLVKFPVSRKMVETFINDFYVETKEVSLEEGLLKQYLEVN